MLDHDAAVHSAPETKSTAVDAALVGEFETFMRQFELYREENERRLAEIEKRGAADPLVEEKLARLDRALDDSARLQRRTLDARRPRLDLETRAEPTPAAREHAAAFDAYVRGGGASELRRLEAKALSIGSDVDGGYLVPHELERNVTLRLAEISPIRAIAGNRSVSGSSFSKPFSATGPAVGWVSESAVRPQTSAQQLRQLSFPTMELYAMPAATQSLLDDAAVDVESWIAEEVQQAFAEQESAAFVAGDGIAKPKGFMAYDRVAADAWVWGRLGYVATGVAGALPATAPSDRLVDLVYALKAGYRQNASWVMNRRTQAEIRKLKDAQGHYLWQPPAVAGGRATLMSFPLVEAEEMPQIAVDSCPIAFGDFRRGYLVVDRLGVRVLRDPYSAKPYVLFYTTKRVGGGVQDFDAIKLLKFGTA